MSRRNLFCNRSLVLMVILPALLLWGPAVYGQKVAPRSPQLPRGAVSRDVVQEVLKMRVTEGRVHAEIAASPLHKVLEELADRTGIIFEVRSHHNPLISVNFHGVSYPEAIQRIVAGSNTIFFYRDDIPDRIRLVRVLPAAGSVQQPGIVYLGKGAVTKSSMEIETPAQAIDVLEHSPDPEARERAVALLSQSGNNRAIDVLKKSLNDSVADIRIAAIEGLALLGAREALPEIVQRFRDSHSGVRHAAVRAVALLGSAENIDALRLMSADSDVNVAEAAEIALQELSTSEQP